MPRSVPTKAEKLKIHFAEWGTATLYKMPFSASYYVTAAHIDGGAAIGFRRCKSMAEAQKSYERAKVLANAF